MPSHPIGSQTTVIITDADGVDHLTKALSGIEQHGQAMPIIWVQRPLYSGGFEPCPWPAEYVRTTDDG